MIPALTQYGEGLLVEMMVVEIIGVGVGLLVGFLVVGDIVFALQIGLACFVTHCISHWPPQQYSSSEQTISSHSGSDWHPGIPGVTSRHPQHKGRSWMNPLDNGDIGELCV